MKLISSTYLRRLKNIQKHKVIISVFEEFSFLGDLLVTSLDFGSIQITARRCSLSNGLRFPPAELFLHWNSLVWNGLSYTGHGSCCVREAHLLSSITTRSDVPTDIRDFNRLRPSFFFLFFLFEKRLICFAHHALCFSRDGRRESCWCHYVSPPTWRYFQKSTVLTNRPWVLWFVVFVVPLGDFLYTLLSDCNHSSYVVIPSPKCRTPSINGYLV